jgi:hypothetical protein
VEQRAERGNGVAEWSPTALLIVGVSLLALGGFAWGFDVDPQAGRLLLLIGAATVVLGWAARTRPTPLPSRLLLVALVVLVVLLVAEGTHLLWLFGQQHGANTA